MRGLLKFQASSFNIFIPLVILNELSLRSTEFDSFSLFIHIIEFAIPFYNTTKHSVAQLRDEFTYLRALWKVFPGSHLKWRVSNFPEYFEIVYFSFVLSVEEATHTVILHCKSERSVLALKIASVISGESNTVLFELLELHILTLNFRFKLRHNP